MTSDQHLPSFDYDTPSIALTQLLEWLEDRIDLAHVAAVEDRHIRALQWQPVDRPPVTFSAPVMAPFAVYPYSEVFRDPTKMLVNELVGPYAALGPSPSIVNSVLIKDDYPLQIRAFYGVGLFVSLFGAESKVVQDNFPWTRPIGLEALKQHVAHGVPDLKSGLFQRVLDTMAYYKEVLSPYPKCRQAIHITQPDLQGPFENAGHLWGSDVFYAFYDDPAFFRELLDLLGQTWVLATHKFAAESTEAARDGFIYLHFSLVKGQGLLKDDSCVMLSPETYAEFIRPLNERVLHSIRGGGIHWCGKGDQWQTEVLKTKDLLCLDWGNPEMLNLSAWAGLLRERRLPVTRMEWKVEDFLRLAPIHLFPTGAAFTVIVDNFEQAKLIFA